MDISEKLQDFMGSPNDLSTEFANAIKIINDEYKNGDYDAETCKELIDDAKEVIIARSAASSLETKVRISKIIDAAYEIIGSVI